MSSIIRRPDGQWRARYRDDVGREHARHFARKIDGQQWLDTVTTALVSGQYVDPQAARVTVATYAGQWAGAHVGSESTARIIDNALRLHVLPRLGPKPMGSVRRSDIQAMVKSLSDSLAPGTVRNVYDVTARVFAAAVDDRVIASSPCKKIQLPRLDDSEVTPLTVEQVGAFADAMPERYRAAVVLLAGSGLRIGELLGLQVGDVDFLRRTIRVERQRLQDGTLTGPKTSKSARTVPVGSVVVDELAAHLARFPSNGSLFTTTQGAPVAYRGWKRAWSAARTATGTDATTHDLRHFYASALIAGGASVKQVQTVLGHSSAMITLRTYAHLWPGDEDRTRAVIDATLGILRTGCGLDDQAGSVSAGQQA